MIIEFVTNTLTHIHTNTLAIFVTFYVLQTGYVTFMCIYIDSKHTATHSDFMRNEKKKKKKMMILSRAVPNTEDNSKKLCICNHFILFTFYSRCRCVRSFCICTTSDRENFLQ